MHATTIAKIEAGSRSVRINEAVAIADLLETSLDSLLARQELSHDERLAQDMRSLHSTAVAFASEIDFMNARLRKQLPQAEHGDFPVEVAEELLKLRSAVEHFMQTAENAARHLEGVIRMAETVRNTLSHRGGALGEAQS